MSMSRDQSDLKLLVVEDETTIASHIAHVLTDEGFDVRVANSLAQAREMLADYRPNMVLMDLGLPDGDGLDLLAQIRGKPGLGLLIITGRSDEVETVVGFEMGADDYIVKPFRARELVARVKAVSRRLAVAESGVLPVDHGEFRFGEFTANLGAGWVTDSTGSQVELTAGEMELLMVFLNNRGETLSRERIRVEMFGNERLTNDRFVDGLVSRLRRKLAGNEKTTEIIRTVHGRGYRFVP